MKGIMSVGRKDNGKVYRYIKFCDECGELYKPFGRSRAVKFCDSCKEKRKNRRKKSQ